MRRCRRSTCRPLRARSRSRHRAARHAQDPHLGLLVNERERTTEQTNREGQLAHAYCEPSPVRQEELAAQEQEDPVARGARPLQKREVAARILEQRALVDHRQLEMCVWVIDRLAPGLHEDDEHECDQATPVRRPAPDVATGRRGAHRRQIGAVGGQGRDGKWKEKQGLAEHRDHQLTHRSHQREAVTGVRRRRGQDEPGEREHPDEHERIVAETEAPGAPGDRNDRKRGEQARGDERRSEPVDHACPLRVDRALVP